MYKKVYQSESTDHVQQHPSTYNFDLLDFADNLNSKFPDILKKSL